PARTPRAIVDQLNSSFEELLASPEVKERFRNEGLEAQPSSPNEFAARIKDDVAKWAKVVKRAEIKPE
ncbi:MAG TPA: tripartite tricarboxylate transporter substrate-binding protein, partial [Alphaproteobacteria bacterium]|nr:tripartite tricarboxylate transporter substrate-binding protein [Alphaproteobacteria bacterium]